MQTVVIQAFGNCEYIVKVFAIKHIPESGFNPFIALRTLTLWTVSISATVIRNMYFPAVITLFYMTPKCRSPAIGQRIEYPFVIIQNRVLQIERFHVSPNNICDFKLRFHPKNGKAYPKDFSLILAKLEQYEDRRWWYESGCVQEGAGSYINQRRLPADG